MSLDKIWSTFTLVSTNQDVLLFKLLTFLGLLLAFHDFLKIDKMCKTGQSKKSYFQIFMNLFGSGFCTGAYIPKVTDLGIGNLQYDIRISHNDNDEYYRIF